MNVIVISSAGIFLLSVFCFRDRLVLSYRLVFFEHAERNCAKYERNGTITLMVKLLSENSVQ